MLNYGLYVINDGVRRIGFGRISYYLDLSKVERMQIFSESFFKHQECLNFSIFENRFYFIFIFHDMFYREIFRGIYFVDYFLGLMIL